MYRSTLCVSREGRGHRAWRQLIHGDDDKVGGVPTGGADGAFDSSFDVSLPAQSCIVAQKKERILSSYSKEGNSSK